MPHAPERLQERHVWLPVVSCRATKGVIAFNLFVSEQCRMSSDVLTVSPQNTDGTLFALSKLLAMSRIARLRLSTTLFFYGEYGTVRCLCIPSSVH